MLEFDITIGPYKFRGWVVAFVMVGAFITAGYLMASCSTVKDWREGFDIAAGTHLSAPPKAEGFTSSQDATSGPMPNDGMFGPEFSETNAPGYIRNPDTWVSTTSYDYSEDTGQSAGSSDIFANMRFGYDCCPNAYSNSMGCACMGTDTLQMLNERGGNNVPFSA